MEHGCLKLDDNDKLLPDSRKYKQTVGALLYLETVTRQDISAAINILSHRNENPREKGWNARHRMLTKYLKYI